MATKATTTKKQVTVNEPSSGQTKANKSLVFRKFPWWGVLVGCIIVVVAYVAILYYFFVGPLSFRWRAIFGEPNYPEGYEVHGIDISHYQKGVQWDILRESTINDCSLSFVIVKATEGMTLVDEDFINNFYRVRAENIVRGAYHFFIPSCNSEQQAEFYHRQVQLEPGDLPPILDIERRGEKPLSEFQADVKTWLDLVQAAYDIAPIIYTNLDFKKKYLNDTLFDSYPLWIANYYTNKLEYDGKWALWQYTDMGKVDGINHNVDFNLFNGNTRDFYDFLIPERDSVGS